MKTEVVMKRELFGREISQKSKSEFFSATDLVRAGDEWRAKNGISRFNMNDWFNQKNTKEFIAELEVEFGTVKISGRGRGKHTWVHPLLFIDMALAISPKLKVEVYKWIYDSLLKFRNDSGDSYKKMTGYLWDRMSNKSNFRKYIVDVSNKIRKACNVEDWEHASEEQLNLRDKMHDTISTIASVMNNEVDPVRLGISHVLKEHNKKLEILNK